ncbi:MAG: DNA methyltransferase [Candidatus Moraniibacteriota bacterium]
MNILQIEKNLEIIAVKLSKSEFVFDLLLAYGVPRATVKLLKDGRYNLSKQADQIILKKRLFFQKVKDKDLHITIDALQNDIATMRHEPRFIVVTDFETLLAIDTKTKDQLDIDIIDIAKHYDFFLPWAGIEKHRHKNENPADRKAAEKMAKLYDGILAENNISTEERTHDLNVFLSRLLFCFFAEDTNIFEEKLFTNSVASHTQNDGSDLDIYLETFFDALNKQDTSQYPKYLQKFPYVNGGLFAKKHWIPKFSAKSRKIIIECGELNWSEINPDIFGSMMQAVTHPGQRTSLGMHYTSVPNIMKVVGPLFLDELNEEFEKYKENHNKLKNLLGRIVRIKIFDPACGSGNFLIIAYKELRRLEIRIIRELSMLSFSGIKLSNFYGIEIDDFAHEIAKLSLYLAEHQMNIEFLKETGKVNPTLPLKVGGNIFCENATRADWEKVCPKSENDEIYILGNPPYLGFNLQDNNQREDMRQVFYPRDDYKRLDYICCWFIKSSKYIKSINERVAFVSTNSICQGEQVNLLWPSILERSLEINFAHQPFRWSNSAKGNAGVTCVIIGLRKKVKQPCYLYVSEHREVVENINAYLTAGSDVIVVKRGSPLSDMPGMIRGDMPIDGGYLILSKTEKDFLISNFNESKNFIREFVGADEFLKGETRWCLWISNDDLPNALRIPFVRDRIERVKQMRNASKNKTTQELAKTPHLFGQIRHKEVPSIIIPSTTSERREYIPLGFLEAKIIISNLAYSIPCYEPFLFGILSSCMHMTWVRAVAGGLETRIRYTSGICYNTFPIPPLSTKQKEEISIYAYNVIEERERNSEKTIAQLYDPMKMPARLKEAHQSLDLMVERCYRLKPFASDEERLETLFKLYEQMIKEEKTKNNK